MSILLDKIVNIVNDVTRRTERHQRRRKSIATQNKTVEANRLYPANNGTGSVFRNLENLSVYLYSEMVLEATMSPYQMAAGTLTDPYNQWARTSTVEQMAVIRAICSFHYIRPNGITATDVEHRLQAFNISPSQVQRVIADGFRLGVLVEIKNEHKKRYFHFSETAKASAQESYRIRFSNKKIHDCVMHMHKLYSMTSLVNDKENAGDEMGVIPHEPTSFDQIIDLIMEEGQQQANHYDSKPNQIDLVADQNKAKVVQMKPHKKS